MRLIDADRLTHDLTDWQMEQYSDRGHEKEFDILDKVINGISTMPTEVMVVRCKDCMHFILSDGFCTLHESCVSSDAFCSYGERKGGDAE